MTNSDNTIQYTGQLSFYEGIVALVKAGLIFTADHDKLTITLTGGY